MYVHWQIQICFWKIPFLEDGACQVIFYRQIPRDSQSKLIVNYAYTVYYFIYNDIDHTKYLVGVFITQCYSLSKQWYAQFQLRGEYTLHLCWTTNRTCVVRSWVHQSLLQTSQRKSIQEEQSQGVFQISSHAQNMRYSCSFETRSSSLCNTTATTFAHHTYSCKRKFFFINQVRNHFCGYCSYL